METNGNIEAEFLKALANMNGKICWGFIGGRGTGSRVKFNFGEKIVREKLVRNPHLTPEQREFTGEIRLFIQDAAWRVDSPTSVMCSSTTWNDPAGPFGEGLRSLVNHRVKDIKVSKPGFDLIIEFDNEFVLRVFCDQTNTEDEATNYSVHVHGRCFAVEWNNRLICEETGTT